MVEPESSHVLSVAVRKKLSTPSQEEELGLVCSMLDASDEGETDILAFDSDGKDTPLIRP